MHYREVKEVPFTTFSLPPSFGMKLYLVGITKPTEYSNVVNNKLYMSSLTAWYSSLNIVECSIFNLDGCSMICCLQCRGTSLVFLVCWQIQDHMLETLNRVQCQALHKQTLLPLQFRHLMHPVQTKLTGMGGNHLQNLRMWIQVVMHKLLSLRPCLVPHLKMLLCFCKELQVWCMSACS